MAAKSGKPTPIPPEKGDDSEDDTSPKNFSFKDATTTLKENKELDLKVLDLE